MKSATLEEMEAAIQKGASDLQAVKKNSEFD